MNNSFIKFLLVGVINTVVGLTMVYIFLDLFHLHYWISTFLGNTIGAIVSYILNKKFTFKSNAPALQSGVRFVVVILFCYFVSYKLGLIMGHFIAGQWSALLSGYGDEVAVLIGSGLYTITNYLGQRFFVFPERTKKTEHYQ